MKQVSRSDKAILNSGKTANKEHKLVENCFFGLHNFCFLCSDWLFNLSILGYKKLKN